MRLFPSRRQPSTPVTLLATPEQCLPGLRHLGTLRAAENQLAASRAANARRVLSDVLNHRESIAPDRLRPLAP